MVLGVSSWKLTTVSETPVWLVLRSSMLARVLAEWPLEEEFLADDEPASSPSSSSSSSPPFPASRDFSASMRSFFMRAVAAEDDRLEYLEHAHTRKMFNTFKSGPRTEFSHWPY
eukprot:GFYU01041075.1.p1 GENE.GFYU01041075.1~~GFYU01041075.1.p1  ORF type:complete len:114 (-),score=13.22 GFYU01041075.1:130-471(-)